MINGRLYLLTRIKADPKMGLTAWRLTKADGKNYDVHKDIYGHHCDCPDFLWRCKDGQFCKHIRAARALKLL